MNSEDKKGGNYMDGINELPKAIASWSGGEYHEPVDQLVWYAKLHFKCPLCGKRHIVVSNGKGSLPDKAVVRCKTTEQQVEIEFLK